MDGPRAPQIFFYELPAEEQLIGAAIVDNLRALESYRRSFKSGLDLFDFAYANMKAPGYSGGSNGLPWMLIAGRDGAMTLYHFGMTLRSFGGLLKRAPTLARLVDTKAVDRAREMFEDHFKDFYEIRQSVAHLADHRVTPDRRLKHSIRKSSKYVHIMGPRRQDNTIDESQSPPVFARDNFHGRTFWGTVEGESVEYDLTVQSLLRLMQIEVVIYDAFTHAMEETQRSHLERQKSQQPPPSDQNPQKA